MRKEGVSIRDLARLLSRKKTAIARLLGGQFVRIDPKLQRDIAVLTRGEIDAAAWDAFMARRFPSEEAA